MKRFAAFGLAVMLAACKSLEPHYVRPEAPIPTSWPQGDAYLRQSEAGLPALTYRDIFHDGRLQRLVELALVNNRDLRLAAANIAAARAQYRAQRAERFPEVTGSGGVGFRGGGSGRSGTGSGPDNGNGGTTTGSGFNGDYALSVAPTFELDLFGRIRSLTNAELARYFASEAAARATRLTLIGDLAEAWLTYASDKELLNVAEQTVRNAREDVRLTRARLDGGIAPRTDLRQAEQTLYGTEADVAEQRTALAQDVNAMQLLVGAPIDPDTLPTSLPDAVASVGELPAGLDSRILLRRPDVLEAEYNLRAANAEIGAARAQLFPSISLTGLLGLASNALTSLFTGGAFSYSGGANVNLPIFDFGRRRAQVRVTQAQRDAAIATYERAIQTAFREVADALARRGTIGTQLQAIRNQEAAAQDNYNLVQARYRGGISSYLETLDAQRSLYAAQREVVTTTLTRAVNLVTLYRTLGGDLETRDGPTQTMAPPTITRSEHPR